VPKRPSKRGGKRPNAGRKRGLDLAQREEIALEYRHRMKALEAATARRRDKTRSTRQQIFKQAREKSKRFADGRIRPQDEALFNAKLKKLGGAGFDSEGNPIEGPGLHDIYRPTPAPFKRPKGYRRAFIREIAQERGTTERMVERCIKEFDFGP